MRSHDGLIVVIEACAIMTANWTRDVPVVTAPLLGFVAVVDGTLIEATGVLPAPWEKVNALAPDDGVVLLCSCGGLVGLPLLLLGLLLLLPLWLVLFARVRVLEGVL